MKLLLTIALICLSTALYASVVSSTSIESLSSTFKTDKSLNLSTNEDMNIVYGGKDITTDPTALA